MPVWLLIISTCIVAAAMVMTLVNLRFYRRTPRGRAGGDEGLSIAVCIPARNEEANIEACVRSALASDHPRLEVLVYDDQSTDHTPRILERLAAEDALVRLVPTRPLPPGWVGKQWACQQLGAFSNADRLLFIDADVRLSPGCIPAALAHARELDAAMISTFPRQITGTLAERLVVPLIHFILLSYLPFARMRGNRDPSASAACGQFILVRRDAYAAVGGHGAVRDSLHDGVKLPRVFRRAGHHTDLFDGTALCECRMYRGLAQTWRGFAKNAYEGLGSPGLLIFITVLHVVGHVLPFVALGVMLATGEWTLPQWALAAGAAAGAIVHRLILARRFRQSILSALLHPVGIVMMTAVQWHSWLLHLTGRRAWRGRAMAPGGLTVVTADAPAASQPAPASPPHPTANPC